MKFQTLLLAVVALSAPLTSSARASADDSGTAPTYHLFAPVPRSAMRPLSTDRPDTTESPYTVDAGHFQMEMDVAVLAIANRGGTRAREVDLAAVNLKLGLTSFTDLQLILEPYQLSTVRSGSTASVSEGYGATTARLKFNVYGNDGGSTALGLMPYVSYAHGVTEGGLIVDFGASLPGDFSLGAMLETDLVHLDSGRYGVEELTSLTCGHALIGVMSAYVEFAATLTAYDVAASLLAVNGGLTFAVNDDVQLDTGVRVGAVGEQSDVEAFAGVSARF